MCRRAAVGFGSRLCFPRGGLTALKQDLLPQIVHFVQRGTYFDVATAVVGSVRKSGVVMSQAGSRVCLGVGLESRREGLDAVFRWVQVRMVLSIGGE